MAVVTLACGCTLDDGLVDSEHLPNGPPFHVSKLAVVAPPEESESPSEAEVANEEAPKPKKRGRLF